jgi:hypothetical protein
MAVNMNLLRAAQTIILTKIFEDTLKPPGPDEDAASDDAAFVGAGGSIAAQQIAGLMAKAAVAKFP